MAEALRQRRKPLKDKNHVAFVHTLPCLITRETGEVVQAHHLMRVPTNERGGAMRSGDDWIIPLHWKVHADLHNGPWEERTFLGSYGIYGPGVAALIYRLSGDEDACLRAISEIWDAIES